MVKSLPCSTLSTADKLKIAFSSSRKEVPSFPGTAEWFRRFIRDFATLKKDSKNFVLSKGVKSTAEKLKDALIRALVLVHADFTKRLFVHCDATCIVWRMDLRRLVIVGSLRPWSP